ncbi:MAG TPA: FAD-dependent oxidoreductase [Spirochaetia bacterium]|nr:FAD-dependent oxidoreductase [Spirochaetia bacterium]
MHDLIIIGAGPAGLAAALYATKKRLDYLVISKDLGGKSNYSVNLPEAETYGTVRADELVTIYKSRLQYLRHSYKLTEVVSLERIDGGFAVKLDDDSTEEARAVIVASGTHLQKLEAEGAMKFLSRGLGYSSISYSHLFAGKSVFVAGDSDRVVNSAVELSIQADTVTVALLAGGHFDEKLVDRVRGLERVTLVENATIREFKGDEYAREVVITDGTNETTVSADGFFIEPEPVPNTSFLRESGLLEGVDLLDPSGYVRVDGANMTSVPGLFAAGDVTGNGYEQILVSLGEGAKAVLSAYRFLLGSGIVGR